MLNENNVFLFFSFFHNEYCPIFAQLMKFYYVVLECIDLKIFS